jgi:hypothetical protein
MSPVTGVRLTKTASHISEEFFVGPCFHHEWNFSEWLGCAKLGAAAGSRNVTRSVFWAAANSPAV